MPLPPDIDEPTEEQYALVDAVSLSAFSVTPPTIVPFGSSTIAWQVENVAPMVKIRLGTTAVPATGWAVVSPELTRRYVLSATYGRARRTLRSAQVTVDTSACVALEIQGAFSVMRGILEAAVERGEETYWSSDPRNPDAYLWIRPAGEAIEFYMKFRLSNPGWRSPDPWVRLRGRFRFTVVGGALAATDVEADGTVDVNWGIKLIGGWIVSLGLAVNDANEDATVTARAIPTLLASALGDLGFLTTSRGNRWHSAKSGDNNGRPFLEMTQCPWRPPRPRRQTGDSVTPSRTKARATSRRSRRTG